MVEELHRPFVAEMPEETAAIPATLQADLMQHPVGGIIVDLRMAGDDITELHVEVSLSLCGGSPSTDEPSPGSTCSASRTPKTLVRVPFVIYFIDISSDDFPQ